MFDAPPVKRIDPCSLGKWMNGLSDTDRANLRKNLLDQDFTSVPHAEVVRQILAQADKSFDKSTISDHRNERCRCFNV